MHLIYQHLEHLSNFLLWASCLVIYVAVEGFILPQLFLTGTKNSQAKMAPKMEEVLLHMIDWLRECDYKIYAWSGADREQLLHEIKEKTRYLSLKEALGRAEIEPE